MNFNRVTTLANEIPLLVRYHFNISRRRETITFGRCQSRKTQQTKPIPSFDNRTKRWDLVMMNEKIQGLDIAYENLVK